MAPSKDSVKSKQPSRGTAKLATTPAPTPPPAPPPPEPPASSTTAGASAAAAAAPSMATPALTGRILSSTGVTEGFYRRAWTVGEVAPQPRPTTTTITSSTTTPVASQSMDADRTTTTSLLTKGENAIIKSTVMKATTKSARQTAAVALLLDPDAAVRPGALMPPGALGRQPVHDQDDHPTSTAAVGAGLAPSFTSTTSTTAFVSSRKSGKSKPSSSTTQQLHSQSQQQHETADRVVLQPNQVWTHPAVLRHDAHRQEAWQRGRRTDRAASQRWMERAAAGGDGGINAWSAVTSLCYHGMEVIFASVTSTTTTTTTIPASTNRKSISISHDGMVPATAVIGMCARTRLVFQSLPLEDLFMEPNHDGTPNMVVVVPPVIALQSQPVTGQIIVVHADGTVATFYPEPTDPTETIFGRYRWKVGPWIRASRLFAPISMPHQPAAAASPTQQQQNPSGATSSTHMDPSQQSKANYKRSTSMSSAESFSTSSSSWRFQHGPSAPIRHRLEVALAHDATLLLAHGDQLAVFETSLSSSVAAATASPATPSATSTTPTNPSTLVSSSSRTNRNEAELLWTTRLPGRVMAAALSGDGRSIAVVLEDAVVASSSSSSSPPRANVPHHPASRRHSRHRPTSHHSKKNHDSSASYQGSVDDDNNSNLVPSEEEEEDYDDDDEEADADGVHTFERDAGDDLADAPPSVLGRPTTSNASTTDHHDAINSNKLLLVRSRSIGILYKPGPFLVHSAPVSRLSFRGLGHVTSQQPFWSSPGSSSSSNANRTSNPTGSNGTNAGGARLRSRPLGNDLLLTYSNSDSSARIYSQNGWKPLMEWTTPCMTRVDWVRGISAFTLGDLESQKKPTTSSSSSGLRPKGHRRQGSNNPVSGSGDTNDSQARSDSDDGGGGGVEGIGKAVAVEEINAALGRRSQFQTVSTHTTPSSNAGAWIVEVTFQSPEPAVRLSRLTYLKRGMDDLNPTLFESVAAFLPPGCLFADCLLESGLSGLAVDGIWPAWNPWLSESTPSSSNSISDSSAIVTDGTTTTTLRGSAMAYLGLSSGPSHTGGGYFGDSLLGGTQNPPSELRLVATHPATGHVVVLEFPIFAASDLSTLELGSPLRSILSLDAMLDNSSRSLIDDSHMIMASTDFAATSRLVACRDDQDPTMIRLTWRQSGTLNILPQHWIPDDVDPVSMERLLAHARTFCDVSLLPAPLALPNLVLPIQLIMTQQDKTDTRKDKYKESDDEIIVFLTWWKMETCADPSLLVAITSRGTVVIFEIPPPQSTLEPIMPSIDRPFPVSSPSMAFEMNEGVSPPGSVDGHDDDFPSFMEHDVAITPDPDYGLGLRLESQMDGTCAIAGSYKKHPLTGEMLPAEKSGMIAIGDELVSANGMNLEEKSFDDIIAAVREAGAHSGPNNPIRMKFRRPTPIASSPPSTVMRTSSIRRRTGTSDSISGRRSMEHIFGISAEELSLRDGHPNRADGSHNSDLSKGRQKNRSHVVALPEQHLDFDSTADAERDWTQDTAAVVGVFLNAVDGGQPKLLSNCFALVPLHNDDKPSITSNYDYSTKCCVVAYATSCAVELKVLCLPTKPESKRGKLTELGRVGVNRAVVAMDAFDFDCDRSFKLSVCDDSGQIHLIVVQLEATKSGTFVATFERYELFRIQITSSSTRSVVLKAFSVEIMATMQQSGTNDEESIQVWCATPRSGSSLGNGKTEKDEDVQGEYFASSIVKAGGPSECLLDFCFQTTGFLDASPAIITYSTSCATLYLKSNESSAWVAMSTLMYSKTLAPSKFDPLNSFPHLLSALRLIYKSEDEKSFIRSDWHPEGVLAQICTNKLGAQAALTEQIRSLYLWLNAETGDVTQDSIEVPLRVAPWEITSFTLERASSDDAADVSNGNGAAGLFPSKQDEESLQMEALVDFQKLLSGRLTLKSMVSGTMEQTTNNWVSDMATVSNLPPTLTRMEGRDLGILWAVGELVVAPPDFTSLDNTGQFFLFTASLFRKLKGVTFPSTTVNSKPSFQHHGVMIKRTNSSAVCGVESYTAMAAAGALAALTSSCQNLLIERCRRLLEKLDWESVRELRLPMWIRSDVELARLSEDIGQTMYRESRDIMECAIFFIAARKIRKLRNLAATDHTDSGKKYFKFITSYDFSSERGRRAAEKNAFSLLRKCKYRVAASFFLIAEPPFLKSALETIATKLNDLDLAFLVARLFESSELGPADASPGFGLGFGLGGVLGGGGGYAGSGVVPEVVGFSVESRFIDWIPKLGKDTKGLLIDRGLTMSIGDSALVATQLLWLGKKQEASWCISGTVEAAFDRTLIFREVEDVTSCHFACSKVVARTGSENLTAKASHLIDFYSKPFLIRSLAASSRAYRASVLSVARTLSIQGIEIPSLKTLLLFDDAVTLEESKHQTDTAGILPVHGSGISPKGSSIFHRSMVDSAESSPQAAKAPSQNDHSQLPVSSGPCGAQSSIFDDFDCVPRSKPTDVMSSSIFDSFDVPPTQKQKPTQIAASGGIQSSIFDSFDVPAAGQVKVQATEAAADSAPSNFQSYDIRSMGRSTPSGTGEMNSSIFEAFEGPTPRTSSVGKASALETASKAEKSNPNLENGRSEDRTMDLDLTIEASTTPDLWNTWKLNCLVVVCARRLLREIASVMARFHVDPVDPAVRSFYMDDSRLISEHVSEVVQLPCDAESLIASVRNSLFSMCATGNVPATSVVMYSQRLLGPEPVGHRALFSVLLFLSIERGDLAEGVIRAISGDLFQHCRTFSLSYDELVHKKRTKSFASSQFLRRAAARLSWQLESCLWLHRGGGLPLSGNAIKEAIVAVRAGLLMASWNRNFECLEALLKTEPDCLTDDNAGRHLWTSLKLISTPRRKSASRKTTSGGWEFLVDCKRSQATQLLRERPTGCFIIRPHSADRGVFTLSFKTNLVPAADPEPENDDVTPDTSADELSDGDADTRLRKTKHRKVRKDDVVQHAIIRLSDSGFRCGSFGPFTSLFHLLEAVSSSLPFKLRFDLPPRNRVITEEGSQTSPNAVLLRKIALLRAHKLTSHPPDFAGNRRISNTEPFVKKSVMPSGNSGYVQDKISSSECDVGFGLFAQLVVLSLLRRQLSGVVGVLYEDVATHQEESRSPSVQASLKPPTVQAVEAQNQYASASRILGPLLVWCRSMEVSALIGLAPELRSVTQSVQNESVNVVTESLHAIEVSPHQEESNIHRGDAILRRFIQQGSGVEFSTLRLVDGGECTMVLLFNKKDAMNWLVSNGLEQSETEAAARLDRMEKERDVEPVDLSRLPVKLKGMENDEEGVRYRFVDPWEVEALQSRDGETRSASLGRSRFVGFSLGKVALGSEHVFRELGGLPLLELWTSSNGDVLLTKALASVYPPWERDAGGDLHLTNGVVTECPPYLNSIRQGLYRNTLFRRLDLPQRFLALVQVELLDLKNLTSPGGSLSLQIYALLRLKRAGSAANLTNKSRTLDSAATNPVKLGKSTGPNAPASWGSVVRFRFPLPDDISVESASFERDRESLFRGPPSVLQVCVYEKKLLVDHALGTADIATDGLWAGGQLEEWVPLRSEKHGINWFARIRLTLRFELMCLANDSKGVESAAPSVGMRRIEELSKAGGSAREDAQHLRSNSSPDLLGYFESMVH